MSNMIIKFNCDVYNYACDENEKIDFYLPFNFNDNKTANQEYYFDKFSLLFPEYEVQFGKIKEVIILDE